MLELDLDVGQLARLVRTRQIAACGDDLRFERADVERLAASPRLLEEKLSRSATKESEISQLPSREVVDLPITRWRLQSTRLFRDLAAARAQAGAHPAKALATCRTIVAGCTWRLFNSCMDTGAGTPEGWREQIVALEAAGIMPREIAAMVELVRALGDPARPALADETAPVHREAQIAVMSVLGVLEWLVRFQASRESAQDD